MAVMGEFVKVLIQALIGLFMVFGGVLMLASPTTWYALPSWWPGRGNLSAPKAKGWRYHITRILGAIFLIFGCRLLYGEFLAK
jgi:hypothetical protein